MKNQFAFLAAVAMMFAFTAAANAQTGCTDSPENPTVVLALVGSAGAFVASARARFQARRNSK